MKFKAEDREDGCRRRSHPLLFSNFVTDSAFLHAVMPNLSPTGGLVPLFPWEGWSVNISQRYRLQGIDIPHQSSPVRERANLGNCSPRRLRGGPARAQAARRPQPQLQQAGAAGGGRGPARPAQVRPHPPADHGRGQQDIFTQCTPQSTQMLFAGREEPDHHDQPVAELGERQMWRQPAVNPPLRARRTEFQQSVKNTKLTTGPRPPAADKLCSFTGS